MFHCLMCGADGGSRGIRGMSILHHMLLGACFDVGTLWDTILCGFHLLYKI